MKTILYKNATINYSDTGNGSVVVLLHGFLENLSMWDDYIDSFSKNHRIIAIDLLGHGKSDCLGYIHTMEDQADMVHHVLQVLKIKKAIFIGHSMGGYVALAIAELYSNFIKGLVLLNSTSRADSEERKINRDRAIKAVKQNHTNFVRISIANLFSEENRAVLIDEIEHVKKEALKTPLQGIIASLEGMKNRKDREILLHFATYPILLILGKKDGVLPYQENLQQIEKTKAQLYVFPDGHMSHIENRVGLKKVLLDFIK